MSHAVAGASMMVPPTPQPGAAGAAGAGTPVDPPAVAEPEARPGAPGIGDAYFPDYGNGGYDVSHYDIRLRYSPSDDRLSGTTTLSLTPSMRLSRFNLDFVLDVSEVSVDGVKAQAARESPHELVITPAQPLAAGRSVDVAVTYSGVPSTVNVSGIRSRPWWRTRDGAIGAGAPENAWWWFPSNDHPLDKATYTVRVTVPDGTSAISNGVLDSPPMAADPGWKTWVWRSSKPQQTYLALLVLGQYELVHSMTATGMPVTMAYSTRVDVQTARASLERTAEIVAWEASVFGPYPFEALGGVVSPSDGITYALETQTRPIYPISYFGRAGSGDTVVAHENAHQWFGDSAAVARWRDVWLSEGFATYAEWLWSEAQGEGTAQELFDTAYPRYAAGHAFWQVVVGDPGGSRIFDIAVYNRGAMTVHQLRVAVGDDKFFEILRTWTMTRQYGNGSIEDFMALAGSISGQNLQELFTAWLFTAGRPQLTSVSPMQLNGQVSKPSAPRSWAKIVKTQEQHRPLLTAARSARAR